MEFGCSKLVADRFEAKFHYAILVADRFEACSKLVADRFEPASILSATSFETASNQLRTSFEPDTVMEFGFYRVFTNGAFSIEITLIVAAQ